jgi:hypothetical protein
MQALFCIGLVVLMLGITSGHPGNEPTWSE